MSQQNKTDLSEMIAEEFGANAEYVQGLLERFRTNPDLVDDSWRSYFSEMLGDGTGVTQTSGNGAKTSAPVAVVESDGDARTTRREVSAAAAPAAAPVAQGKPAEARPPADVEALP